MNSCISSSNFLVVFFLGLYYINFHVICKQYRFDFFLGNLDAFYFAVVVVVWLVSLGLPLLS